MNSSTILIVISISAFVILCMDWRDESINRTNKGERGRVTIHFNVIFYTNFKSNVPGIDFWKMLLQILKYKSRGRFEFYNIFV